MSIKNRIEKLETRLKKEGKSHVTKIVTVMPGDNEEELVAQARLETDGELIILRYPETFKRTKDNNF